MSYLFSFGEKYLNNDIVHGFKCSNMGGMRKSNALNAIVIISDHTKRLCDDKWYGDVLQYTGMGKVGDQDLNFSQNKTLANSRINGVTVHLFEVSVSREYIYLGEVFLVDKPYIEIQNDDQGNKWNVWMFPLKRTDNTIPMIKESLEKNDEEKRKIAKKLTLSELKEIAKRNESKKVSLRTVTTNVYTRDIYVSEYAKRRATGFCQLCNQETPFSDSNGVPYLECHHIEWIANGGNDTIENAVDLFPNCHSRMHILKRSSGVDKLSELSQSYKI